MQLEHYLCSEQMAWKNVGGETEVPFLILVLLDKQAVEQRTLTRNSFDYSQSYSNGFCLDSILLPSPWGSDTNDEYLSPNQLRLTIVRQALIHGIYNVWRITTHVSWQEISGYEQLQRLFKSPNNWHFARYSGVWRILPGHIVWQIRRILNVAMAQN